MIKLFLQATKEQYELKKKNAPVKTGEESDEEGECGLLNIVDVYRPFQEKNPQFTEADMRGEMITLYETVRETSDLNALCYYYIILL